MMRSVELSGALVLALGLTAVAGAGEYMIGGAGFDMPIDEEVGETDDIEFSSETTVTDEDVVSGVTLTLHDLSHSYLGDLVVILEHVESNRSATFFTNIGGGAFGDSSDFGDTYSFGDDFAGDIWAAAAAAEAEDVVPGGDYYPTDVDGIQISADAALKGAPLAGTWRLTVIDTYAGLDAGALGSWSAVLTGGGKVAVCGDPKSGECSEPNGTPGCSDFDCCTGVCELNPLCCEIAWDETCVELAVKVCGIFIYECDNPNQANDCVADAIEVFDADSIPYNTAGANTDGPDEAGCNSANGDLPIWSDLWYFYIADGDGQLTASNCFDADFDSKIAIYDLGTSLPSEIDPQFLPDLFIACNEDCADDPFFASEQIVNVFTGNVYLVRLGGFEGQTGSGNLNITFTAGPQGCGDEDAGDCCTANGTPFCNEEECCTLVCELDALCCDTEWDAVCAGLAVNNCEDCAPPPPQTCDAGGNTELTQSNDPVADDGQVACAGAGITTENEFARSFDLSVGATAGEEFFLNCVDFGFSNSGTTLEGSIDVYLDPDRGTPVGPELELLASRAVALDGAGFVGNLVAAFEAPVACPVDATIVVVVNIPPSFDGFAVCGGNGAGETAPTYLRSASCGINDFTTYADIGFPDNNWAVTLIGDVGGGGCPVCPDFNEDGMVDGADLGLLLGAWATDTECIDINGDGMVDGADLGLLLGAWGPCLP